MIARGPAFAFRKSVEPPAARRFFGALFALSSLATPFFLGCVAGAVASGRVPPGLAQGDVVSSWINPTAFLGGVLAVGTCAYLAAVLLCADARRERDQVLIGQFRFRALATAAVVGAVSLAGILVLRSDAPRLYGGLLGRALPCLVLSVLAGLASLGLLMTRRFVAARITATAAVAAVVWGWALAQYPYMLIPGLTIEQAAADPVSPQELLGVLLGGSVLLAPALVYMYVLFQRAVPHAPDGQDTPSGRPAA